jgi:p-cumate 2,3-dioxygenase subunit beta
MSADRAPPTGRGAAKGALPARRGAAEGALPSGRGAATGLPISAAEPAPQAPAASRRASVALRLAVEEFLYEEAALLDDWQLDEWVSLFTDDARYVVPTTDLPDGDPRRDLVLIDDDLTRLRGRVERLKSRHAHREYPWSRTRRLITNVLVRPTEADEVTVRASFVVYRIRGEMAPFVGHYEYRLVPADDSFRIRYRRAVLDLEALREHGSISIIL